MLRLLSFSLIFFLLAPTAYAQQELQVEGLSINPFLIEVEAKAGQTTTRSITLTNISSNPITFTVSINDFTVDEDAGQPLFLDSDEVADPKFSLSSWITITKQPEFTIAPRESTDVEFAITPPENAEPGTHYGGILFARPLAQSNGSASIVQHQAGTIILVKLGKSQEKVNLKDFSTNHQTFSSKPVTFTTTLENVGNIHAKPKGEITVKNIFGNQVAQLPINRDANIVLPESKREFVNEWKPKFTMGYYTAEAIIYYGNPKLELREQISFWVLPIKELAVGLLALILLIVLFRTMIRSYNRYILTHSRDKS